MSIVWNNSLSRRIAVGFVLLVAGIIAAQSAAFLWLLNRSEAAQPQLLTDIRAVASDLGAQLATRPELDIETYLARKKVGPPLFAIMRDGRVIGRRPPENICELVLRQFGYSPNELPSSWETSEYHGVPINAGAKNAGVLGIVPLSTWQRFGSQMIVLGAVLLVAGTILAALLVGGPVRRRLSDLGGAARRIGSGDLAARARDAGADEIAEFTRTFNAMAVQIEARAKESKESDQARSQLVAEVSHELMTPLTAIRGHLETIGMDDVRLEAATRKRFVAVMMRETKRLERLIGDLLDMARLEAGGGGLDLQTVHVEDLFGAVLEHHETECRTRGIHMTCAIAPGAEILMGDPFRLEQAVENLTANAMRHTDKDGTIVLNAERDPGTEPGQARVVLTVTDSGEGIPPEDLPLIFDRFYKAKSDRQDGTRGSGLGLSIVKAIVERHGGRVRADSALGKGTTV